MTNIHDLIQDLIAAAPELDAVRREHLADNDELLPHVADPLPWWRSFRLAGESGFIFTVYAVPRDLPRAQRLTCSATVVNPGRGFIDRVGQPTLYVSKFSEH